MYEFRELTEAEEKEQSDKMNRIAWLSVVAKGQVQADREAAQAARQPKIDAIRTEIAKNLDAINAITLDTDINQILADLVTSLALPGRVGCTVDLSGGTNAAPTGQGILDKATLNGTPDWVVTTN
jgi:hypothetical protein